LIDRDTVKGKKVQESIREVPCACMGHPTPTTKYKQAPLAGGTLAWNTDPTLTGTHHREQASRVVSVLPEGWEGGRAGGWGVGGVCLNVQHNAVQLLYVEGLRVSHSREHACLPL